MGTSFVEIVYRGVLQMPLARRIGRGIMLGARKENKRGFTFGRYGDSPERIGIPAKRFVVIGDCEEDLQPFMTPYELTNNDVTVVLDDTLRKGVESWAWHGLQPINRLTKPGGTLLILSQASPDELIRVIPIKGVEYNLAIVRGSPTWSSMWRYDDDTDVRILGAMAKVARIISLDSVEYVIAEEWGQKDKVELAGKSYDEVQVRSVAAGEGIEQAIPQIELPAWQQIREALVIPAIPGQKQNPDFKGLAARTKRPLIDSGKCRKCNLCWLHCPEGSLDIMPDGFFNINLEYCNGCGICASICPVEGCIDMVTEQTFAENASWQER